MLEGRFERVDFLFVLLLRHIPLPLQLFDHLTVVLMFVTQLTAIMLHGPYRSSIRIILLRIQQESAAALMVLLLVDDQGL